MPVRVSPPPASASDRAGRKGPKRVTPPNRRTRSRLPGTAAEREFVRKHGKGGKGNIFENFGSDIASMVLGTPAFFKGAYGAAARDVRTQP